MSEPKVPFGISFIRSQFTAIAATAADFISLFLLQESQIYQKLLSLTDARSLLYATATASVIGAIISFTLGRQWAFKSTEKNIYYQALKYAIASFIIALINVAGMQLLSNDMGNPYMLSKLVIAAVTGIFISFPLFRYWVFK
jgi:putative flippase GtrA